MIAKQCSTCHIEITWKRIPLPGISAWHSTTLNSPECAESPTGRHEPPVDHAAIATILGEAAACCAGNDTVMMTHLIDQGAGRMHLADDTWSIIAASKLADDAGCRDSKPAAENAALLLRCAERELLAHLVGEHDFIESGWQWDPIGILTKAHGIEHANAERLGVTHTHYYIGR